MSGTSAPVELKTLRCICITFPLNQAVIYDNEGRYNQRRKTCRRLDQQFGIPVRADCIHQIETVGCFCKSTWTVSAICQFSRKCSLYESVVLMWSLHLWDVVYDWRGGVGYYDQTDPNLFSAHDLWLYVLIYRNSWHFSSFLLQNYPVYSPPLRNQLGFCGEDMKSGKILERW